MQRDSRSPRHYLDAVEGAQKELLLEIRALIREMVPGAAETIEYGMLGYGGIANLAAQKHYVSLYVSPKALARFKEDHPSADCGKSCLRFRSAKDFDPAAVRSLLAEIRRMREDGESAGCC